MGDIAAIAEKLSKIIPRLATDHDGEVVATVAALRRILSTQGLDLHDLAKALASPQSANWYQPPPPEEEPWDNHAGNQYRRWGGRQHRPQWEDDVRWCLTHENRRRLSVREMDFLESLFDWEELTAAQEAWLIRIKTKLERKNRQGEEFWDWGE